MIKALEAIRARLSVDAELVAFFTAQYNKSLKHLFGYKTAMKADDYPILSYVCTKGSYGLNGHDKGFMVSLVLGLNDARVVDANSVIIANENIGTAQFLTFLGAQNTSAAIELIIASLKKDEGLGDFLLVSDVVVFSEIPPNTPFFNTEITFQLKQSGSRNLGRV